MTRPVYETLEDRAEQIEVAKKVAVAWDCDVLCLPRLSRADYKLSRAGRTEAWAEHKRRRVPMEKYDTLILSRAKAEALRRLSELDDVPAVVFVQYDDALVWARLTERHMEKTVKAGRRDRGDPFDIEKCIEIPISEMRKVKSPGG
jgi:hypothetical protein